jgi:hypothetical protein
MINPLDTSNKVEVGKPEAEQKPTEELLNTRIVDEAETHALAHSLGLENQSDIQKYQDQIGRIMEWAKLKGAQSLSDIIVEVKGLQNRVGDKNIFNVAVYAGLELERLRIDQKLRKMESR